MRIFRNKASVNEGKEFQVFTWPTETDYSVERFLSRDMLVLRDIGSEEKDHTYKQRTIKK